MTLRRVLAALAGCVLVMSGLVAPSGAVAAPSVPDPVVSVEPLSGEAAASSSDEVAVSEDEADEPKPSDDEAKKPAPKAAADEGKKPVPKAGDDEKSDEATSGGSSGSSGDKGKASTGDETTKPSTSDDEPSDEPKAPAPDGDATSGGVKHSGGGKARVPTDDDDALSDDDASEGDSDEAGSVDADEAPPVRAGVTSMSAPLTSISAKITEDGNSKSTDDAPISFASHQEPATPDGLILDENPNNGVVAANDSVIYRITAVQDQSSPGTQTLVAVLPPGMEWAGSAEASNPLSSASPRCDVAASRSSDLRTLTCSWTNDGLATMYSISARAWVWSVANGAIVAPILYDGSTSGASFTSPAFGSPDSWSVQVAARPNTEIHLYIAGLTQNVTFNTLWV